MSEVTRPTPEQFLSAVLAMREAQHEFFRSSREQRPAKLVEAKRRERVVDQLSDQLVQLAERPVDVLDHEMVCNVWDVHTEPTATVLVGSWPCRMRVSAARNLAAWLMLMIEKMPGETPHPERDLEMLLERIRRSG